MNYRKLGNLTVSSVGLGCMGMSQSYGAPAEKKEMRELIAAAIDMGITHFDTAEVYGTPDDPHDNERSAQRLHRIGIRSYLQRSLACTLT